MATPQINIINNTVDNDSLNLAIYQKFSATPNLTVAAWRTASPSVGTTAYVPIPDNYAVHVIYPQDGISYKTQCLGITDYEGSYQVSKDGNDITLSASTTDFPDNQVLVSVAKKVAQAVDVCITLGGDVVYPPQTTSPGDSQDFSIIPTLYLAKVKPEVVKGGVLVAEELSTSEVAIQPGQTAYVTGDINTGYTITVKNGLYTAPCGN
ncbi:hypothetical protein KXD93_10790 [Mucilaginibacter sp. BJC16-A38]|uniref:hypothetical protein n=1 Tax=Mucilaginibacter phenanthrenivorans TaxID=1234842 RepID=UPI00215765BF|nr:hypothetical protein [Mucilaginibacter phenanthrenivorans]MCR8558134.1 hypothetical protein [Mucilaginibacter phenanthrenivorans]